MNPASTNILILGTGSDIGTALLLHAKDRANHRLLLVSRSRKDWPWIPLTSISLRRQP